MKCKAKLTGKSTDIQIIDLTPENIADDVLVYKILNMKRICKYMLILAVNFLPFSVCNLFAQLYDLKNIDIELCKIYNDDQQIRRKLAKAMQKP
jgi:hypothetical protein